MNYPIRPEIGADRRISSLMGPDKKRAISENHEPISACRSRSLIRLMDSLQPAALARCQAPQATGLGLLLMPRLGLVPVRSSNPIPLQQMLDRLDLCRLSIACPSNA